MTGPAMCCCTCGAPLGRHTCTYKLETHEIVCQATGAGRLVTVDAAVACSTNCLSEYLDGYPHGRKVPT